ncbi:unnamed protein product [Phytomonas sp. EM1]|nr:unnamed protein product [Phytomonas sp. EM1]|eukprot:CCW63243.1 unnamed protein product [Phytomonas sp. isolate EM1]
MANKNAKGNAKREVKQLSHPRDRRVRQLEKKEKRNKRLVGNKNKIKAAEAQKVARFFWFREQCKALGCTHKPIFSDDVLPLIQLYINRNQKEISELKSLRNPPHGSIKQLEMMFEAEMDAFRSTKGVAIPSLVDADDVEILTEIWDGQAETAVVVPVQHVSLGQKVIDENKLHALEARIKSIDAVRQEGMSVLPKLFKSNTKAKKTEKKSVKRQVTIPEELQKRSILKSKKMQQKKQSEVREALLRERRGN